MKILSC